MLWQLSRLKPSVRFSIVNKLFKGGQDAHPTRRKLTLCGTGILPVIENSAIVDKLFKGGQDAHPTRIKLTLCGTGILPVIENSARCETQPGTSYFQLPITNCHGRRIDCRFSGVYSSVVCGI
jgi:hypothetical protein